MWLTTEAVVGASLLVGIAWGTVGCHKIDSTAVRTSRIYTELIVTEHSTAEATVDATLWEGDDALSTTYLTLTGRDRLTAYLGSDVYPMQGHADITEHYSATIPYPVSDAELRVAFDRGPDDVSAPDSTVIVPGLFTLAPLAKSEDSRANDTLEIDWAPSDPTEVVTWSVYGTCVQLLGDASAVRDQVARWPRRPGLQRGHLQSLARPRRDLHVRALTGRHLAITC